MIDFSKLKISSVSKIRRIGKSKGLILHQNLFKEFSAKLDDSIIVYYDSESDCVILKRGGM